MSDEGWFKVWRGWRANALFGDEPLSKAEAWLWLIENACHKAKQFDASGTVITVERGQIATSVRRLAESWKWPKSNVDRFLTRLKTGTGDGPMIGTEVGTGQLVITICNYAKYQDTPQKSGTAYGTGNGTPDGTLLGQQRDTNKEGNNSVPNGTGAEPPNPMDLKAMVFSSGRKILTDSGVDPKQAGGIIGRWRQKHSDAAVLDALARCQSEQPEVPLEWIAATLKRGGRQGNFFDSGSGSGRPYHEIVAERHRLGANQ